MLIAYLGRRKSFRSAAARAAALEKAVRQLLQLRARLNWTGVWCPREISCKKTNHHITDMSLLLMSDHAVVFAPGKRVRFKF